MRVQLRQGGHSQLVDLDVEQEVRAGRLFAEDEVCYPPWTGPALRRLGDIPALADAFSSPEARFAAWVRARHPPYASALTVLAVAVAGSLQVLLLVAGALSPPLAERVHAAILGGAIGYEPLLLDGAWWSPWTSQVLHAGGFHLFMNLPVLAYCGFRVERALGIGGFVVVAAASVLGGTVAVTALGTLPVVGASILAYGLWGAQIAIGFRVGDAMPPGWRGFYGWGNLVLFAPLFAAGLGAEGVSDLGHLGGLAGGVLASLLVRAESFRPRAEVSSRRAANLRLGALLGALPMFAGPVLARVTPALALPGERVEVAGAGVTLALPWRMAEHPVRFGGLPAWVVSLNNDDPVFCGLVALKSPADPAPEELGFAWAEALDARLEPEPPPPSPPGEGWESHAWRVHGAEAGGPGRIVEHTLRRGIWLLRVGYGVRAGDAPNAGREALYRHVLATVAVAEPPALSEARRQASLYPTDPERAWTLARALGDVGDVAAADAAWTALAGRADGWRWEALRGRLALWSRYDAAEPAALEVAVPVATRVAWLSDEVAALPLVDPELHADAVSRLVADDACDAARAHADRVEGGGDGAMRAAVGAAAARPCAGSTPVGASNLKVIP